jgi:endonuclease YncB( thermonuclease family)
MVRGVAGIIGAFAALLGGPCLPAWACDLPPPVEAGTVADVLDGDTLKLTDGRIVRLIGAKAPKPPLGWRGDDPWPLVDDAKEALSAVAAGKPVELGFGGLRQDRHGYLLAQVYVVEGENRLWLQQALIAKGLAGSTRSPTIGPASPSCWRARLRRGRSVLGFGASPPIASSRRSTWTAWTA